MVAKNPVFCKYIAVVFVYKSAVIVKCVFKNHRLRGILHRKHCLCLGTRPLGIEPARNIAGIAVSEGIPTVAEFFNSQVAAEVRAAHGPAKAVIGNNVLAHVDDTRDFLVGCRELIDSGGRVIIEVPYLGELLDCLEYDTIYHEHLCYFSVTALLHLCESVGLAVERIDRVPVHGGSLRIWARRAGYQAVRTGYRTQNHRRCPRG